MLFKEKFIRKIQAWLHVLNIAVSNKTRKKTYFNGTQAPRCRTKPLRKITTPTANRMDVVKKMTVTALQEKYKKKTIRIEIEPFECG